MDGPRPDPGNPLPAGVVSDPAAFRKSLGTPQRGEGNTRERNSTSCHIIYCENISVTIEAVGNTTTIDPSKPPAAGDGFPAARLINNDSRRVEKYYHLRPGAEAEYFLWVTRKNDTASQWTLIEVPRVGGQVTAARPTDLRLCNPRQAGEIKKSQADFAKYRHGGRCSVRYPNVASHPKTSSSVKTAAAFSVLPLLRFAQAAFTGGWAVAEGGWIDCSNGCCT